MRLITKTEQLIEARIRKGLSQRGLATKAGITSGYISQIENGLYNPSPKVAQKIAEALSIDFDEIFLIKKPQKSKGTQKVEASV